MSRHPFPLIVLCALWLGGFANAAPRRNCKAGGVCSAPGSSVLQAKAAEVRERSAEFLDDSEDAAEFLDDSEDSFGAEEEAEVIEDAAEFLDDSQDSGEFPGEIEDGSFGAKEQDEVRERFAEFLDTSEDTAEFLDDEVAVLKHGDYNIITHTRDEGEKTWMLDQPSGCSTSELDQFMANLIPGVTARYEGKPSEGGMCILIVSATADALKNELTDHPEHPWPTDVIVEEDKDMWEDKGELQSNADDGFSPSSVSQYTMWEGKWIWGLDRIDQRGGPANNNYIRHFTGQGVNVYVMDSGISFAHEDFGGRAKPLLEVLSYFPRWCNETSDPTCAEDNNGHGTHCAATIGGRTFGVAKDVNLLSVKVMKDQGGGKSSWLVEALGEVVPYQLQSGGPAVFSISMGMHGTSSTVTDAVDHAVAAGVAVVVSAGNAGRTSYPLSCQRTPAGVASAITVGATAYDDTLYGSTSYGSCVDIFAPGQHVLSADNASDTGALYKHGTSMSCPHVSGAVALLFEELQLKNQSHTVEDVTALLLARATRGKLKDNKPGSPNLLLYTGLDTEGPPVCNFQSGLCHTWFQNKQSDNFDWTRKKYGRNYFMFLNTASKRPYQTAILDSVPFEILGPFSLKFQYRMLKNAGRLEVLVDGQRVWHKTGYQGNGWRTVTKTLTSFQGIRTVSFKGVRGKRQGSIFFDNISFLRKENYVVVIGGKKNKRKCAKVPRKVICPQKASGFTITVLSSGQVCAWKKWKWSGSMRVTCNVPFSNEA